MGDSHTRPVALARNGPSALPASVCAFLLPLLLFFSRLRGLQLGPCCLFNLSDSAHLWCVFPLLLSLRKFKVGRSPGLAPTLSLFDVGGGPWDLLFAVRRLPGLSRSKRVHSASELRLLIRGSAVARAMSRALPAVQPERPNALGLLLGGLANPEVAKVALEWLKQTSQSPSPSGRILFLSSYSLGGERHESLKGK